MGSGPVSDDTREAIMGATYRALCDHGYAHLTMQDIADEFDKSRSLLHYHYNTKEDLMLAFLEHLIGWIGDCLAESETEEPLERLAEYVDRFVIDEEGDGFALALLELRLQAVHNDAYRDRLARHYEENIATAASIIEDGIQEDVFREVDPEVTGETIYTLLEGARMYQVTLDAAGATRRMRETIETYIIGTLLV